MVEELGSEEGRRPELMISMWTLVSQHRNYRNDRYSNKATIHSHPRVWTSASLQEIITVAHRMKSKRLHHVTCFLGGVYKILGCAKETTLSITLKRPLTSLITFTIPHG